MFDPDVEFLGLDGRELAGDVRNGVKGDWMRMFLRRPDTFMIMCEVYFEGLH